MVEGERKRHREGNVVEFTIKRKFNFQIKARCPSDDKILPPTQSGCCKDKEFVLCDNITAQKCIEFDNVPLLSYVAKFSYRFLML